MTTEHPPLPLSDEEIEKIRKWTNRMWSSLDTVTLSNLLATIDQRDGIIEGLRQEVLDAGALYAEQGRLLHHAQETIEALRAEREELADAVRWGDSPQRSTRGGDVK